MMDAITVRSGTQQINLAGCAEKNACVLMHFSAFRTAYKLDFDEIESNTGYLKVEKNSPVFYLICKE